MCVAMVAMMRLVLSIDGISDLVMRMILGAVDGEHLRRLVHQPLTIRGCEKILAPLVSGVEKVSDKRI